MTFRINEGESTLRSDVVEIHAKIESRWENGCTVVETIEHDPPTQRSHVQIAYLLKCNSGCCVAIRIATDGPNRWMHR